MFLGLDLSLSSSGVVIISDDYKIQHQSTISVKQVGVERLYFLESELLKILQDYIDKIELVAIESPAYRDTGKLFDLGEWAGIVKLNLFKNTLPYILVAPLQLKKYVSGKGKNKGKDVVLLDIYKNFGEEIRQDDIGDAYVLSRIAKDFYHYQQDAYFNGFEYQKEVLKVIKKSWNKKLI